METVIEHLAAASATDPLTLREANMVRTKRVISYVLLYSTILYRWMTPR